MQLPLKKITETASNGHQTTSLLIYTEMLKFVIICTGDAVRCHLFGGRIKTHEKTFPQHLLCSYLFMDHLLRSVADRIASRRHHFTLCCHQLQSALLWTNYTTSALI